MENIFSHLFYVDVITGFGGWWYLRTWCWGIYLDLIEMNT